MGSQEGNFACMPASAEMADGITITSVNKRTRILVIYPRTRSGVVVAVNNRQAISDKALSRLTALLGNSWRLVLLALNEKEAQKYLDIFNDLTRLTHQTVMMRKF